MTVANNINQSNNKNTPSTLNRWRFAGLSAAELLPHLQRHLTTQNPKANWQLVWLNNNGKPVIGLLPKVSWSVYFRANQPSSTSLENTQNKTSDYKVIKIYRDSPSSTTDYLSYQDWQDELIAYSRAYDKANNSKEKPSDSIRSELIRSELINRQDDKPEYQHGLIGFIGYDIAAHELSPTANIPQVSQPELQPCAVLGHYDIYLSPVKDNNNDNNQTLWQLTTPLADDSSITADQAIIAELKHCLQHLDDELSNEQLNSATNNQTIKSQLKNQTQLTPLVLKAKWQKSDYQQAFLRTQSYLVNGDCYQINLTQAWQGFLNQPNDNEAPQLLDYLPNLNANTNAPFAGYLGLSTLTNSTLKSDKQDTLGFELLSCSPELFFTFTTDYQTNTQHIITKPIKGTMPRGINVQQDYALKQQLIASDKDRSENVMIVDLLRNDLGRYAKIGSVKVPQLFAIESFSNVHHMVSTITAELKTDVHPLAVLFGSLPAGSITGTPKKRAVEIIAELEGAARGAYCGTMGYMNFDGSGQWNVLIRTLQANKSLNATREVSLWAGGGITIASDCASEYQECLDKVGNLLGVLQQPNF